MKARDLRRGDWITLSDGSKTRIIAVDIVDGHVELVTDDGRNILFRASAEILGSRE